MAIGTGLVRAGARTTVGTQDFRDPNMTLTPNAARFTIIGATVDGTITSESMMGHGATDGSNDWALAGNSEDNVATTVTERRGVTTGCVLSIDNAGAIDGLAAFSSFLADVGAGAGIRIDWTNAPASAWLVIVELFAVDNAGAGTFFTNGTIGGTTTITTNFQSALIFSANYDFSPFVGAPENAQINIGACDAGLNQNFSGNRNRNNVASTEMRAIIRNDAFTGNTFFAGPGGWWADVTSITATTFVVTTRNTGIVRAIGYLALDTGAIGTWVDSIDIPNSTGNQGYVGPSFTPQMAGIGSSLLEAENSENTSDLADSYTISAFTANDEFSQSINGDDGAGTSDNHSLSDNQSVVLLDSTGALDIEGAFVSFDANGWTTNWTNVSTNVKKAWAWAIEEEEAGALVTGSASISGLGDLNSVGLNQAFGLGGLIGAGAIGSNAFVQINADGSLINVGVLVVDGFLEIGADADIVGSGALSGDSQNTSIAAAGLTGDGALSSEGQAIGIGLASLVGAGAIATDAQIVIFGDGSLANAGALTVDGTLTTFGVASLTGIGALVAVGDISGIVSGLASLVGAGALATDAIVQVLGDGTLANAGVLTVDGLVQVPGDTSLTGSGLLTVDGLVQVLADADLTGTGALIAIGEIVTGIVSGVASLTGAGALATDALVQILADGSLANAGQLSVDGLVQILADGTMTGLGALIASGTIPGVITIAIVTPDGRTYLIAMQDRIYEVPLQNRVYEVNNVD